ncbi:hypothetical protein GWK47_000245 [Chionoecetes opilio]|uniref:Uncharacterized protein n=1 Tax=Chionoecetes opilio TaxID=41210 RepID=A0A8J8WL65_CHIOP|nr:hypothetical protein GWK47_000245 [Chionoecetes opilio]
MEGTPFMQPSVFIHELGSLSCCTPAPLPPDTTLLRSPDSQQSQRETCILNLFPYGGRNCRLCGRRPPDDKFLNFFVSRNLGSFWLECLIKHAHKLLSFKGLHDGMRFLQDFI